MKIGHQKFAPVIIDSNGTIYHLHDSYSRVEPKDGD